MTESQKDIINTFQSFILFPGAQQLEPCQLILSHRYLYIRSVVTQDTFRIPIPNISSINRQDANNMNRFSLQIICKDKTILACFEDKQELDSFQVYLENVVNTSAMVLMRTKDFIFSNADEGSVDPDFISILQGIYTCEQPDDLKHLLNKVKNYQNNADISLLFIQKQYYLHFVEYLRYLPENLVTNELMKFAVSLESGFDDIIDNAYAGDDLKPVIVDIKAVFVAKQVIGKGKYGTVYRGRIANYDKDVAIKRISKRILSKKDYVAIMREAAMMYKLRRHPNIVGLRAFWEDKDNFYLVQDVMEGGELFNAIVSRKRLSEAEAQRLTLTLVFTLQYCHQRCIIHRDLKPENILLREEGNLESICLADFGLSRYYEFTDNILSYCGTPGYIAPEILKNKPYGTAVDMWSLGVIVYILLSGSHPFTQNDDVLMRQQILEGAYSFHGEVWRNVSDKAKEFISKLMVVDPSNRMTALQAMNHPWMLFQSKSTMNMNTAVQELERFNALRNAHAVDKSLINQYARQGVTIWNYITVSDTLVYINPTTSQEPYCSLPRGSVIGICNLLSTAEGPWLQIYDNTMNEERSLRRKWILAGKKQDTPCCIPVNACLYKSMYKVGKAFHIVKKSPSRTETITQRMPGGYYIVVDSLVPSGRDIYGVINPITLYQFDITIPSPVYVCIEFDSQTVIFNKIYGNWIVC